MSLSRPPSAPPPAPVPDWAAAERNALLWLRWLGHSDAELTRSGADDGIDVRSATALAQVKWYGKAIGVRPLRELVGAAEGADVRLYFFCNAGFTREAVGYANRVGIGLFSFSPADGMISAANSSSSQIFAAAAQHHHAEPGATRPEGPASFQSLITELHEPQSNADPPGPLGTTILLTPVVMCLVGAVAIAFFSKNPDHAPAWMREVWATWMTVACVAALPALVYARIRSRR